MTLVKMRLYLLPISTRRTLLYCQRLNATTPETRSWIDKATAKAARTWADWEKKESGWQRWTVDWGNRAFRRIPYEEWGLKSVPPLSNKRRGEELDGKERVELVFPGKLIPRENAVGVLQRLGTERDALHRSRLKWTFVGMPIMAPVGLIPLVPNLPFFYLLYRAWSHWRAIEGGKHINFLVANNLLTLSPSAALDTVYSNPSPPPPVLSSPVPTVQPPVADHLGVNRDPKSNSNTDPATAKDGQDPTAETMLLTQKNRRRLAEDLDVPELEIELERAIWQVETAIAEKKAQVTGTPVEEVEKQHRSYQETPSQNVATAEKSASKEKKS